MYFYSLGLTKHVSGEVSEPEEGIYRMDLHSADNSIACVLENTTEEIFHGPRNTVEITCTAPGFAWSSNSAVVNVTGPEREE
jgi:hypothetical protein